jgi:predicted phage terminase large subunit-like protein
MAWPTSAKLRLYGEARWRQWLEQAHEPQKPPDGDWRTWYLQGGRGSGKTRTGSETLCHLISQHGPADWGIVAPTYGDARDVCAEGGSGILKALQPMLLPGSRGWNRSIGEINLIDGSRIYLDGADDGALRIQGKNLAGLWADEVGLWKKWEQAWMESIAFAVRIDPARIIATGTPKMGHGLVELLIDADDIPVSRLRTRDNLANLDAAAVADLERRYGGTILGKQELEGEFIKELEGDLLKRSWWQFYDPRLLGTARTPGVQTDKLPRFTMLLVSVDTPLKDKESSDNVAIQVWGVHGANRYLLSSRVDKMGYEAAKRTVKGEALWARENWPTAAHRVLIENAGYGVELIVDLKREIGLVEKYSPGPEGSKGMRALAASGDLETGNVFLPGRRKADLSGPDEHVTPKFALSLVEEAARFQLDGSHSGHDDQVDAFSMAMNWLRSRSAQPLRTSMVVRQPVRAARRIITRR